MKMGGSAESLVIRQLREVTGPSIPQNPEALIKQFFLREV